jgi:hypothetical protein
MGIFGFAFKLVLSLLQDKKLSLPSFRSLPDTIAQKAAESLAVALEGYEIGGVNAKAQEVFGVGVRHRFFSFWHTGMFRYRVMFFYL